MSKSNKPNEKWRRIDDRPLTNEEIRKIVNAIPKEERDRLRKEHAEIMKELGYTK